MRRFPCARKKAASYIRPSVLETLRDIGVAVTAITLGILLGSAIGWAFRPYNPLPCPGGDATTTPLPVC